MFEVTRYRVAALVATASLSGCFFLTDFDGLSGEVEPGAGGAVTSGGGMAGMGGSAAGGFGTGGKGMGADGGGGAAVIPMVVINELVADPLPSFEDWIEFYNADSGSVDISDWYFTDGNNQFTFPASTVLPPDGYLVLDRNAMGSFTFGFSKTGETLRLYTADAALVDTTTWVAGDADQPNSWGRLPNGTGMFQTLTPTKGSANQ